MILVIDNYDSFVHNLVHYLGVLGCPAVVRRNDAITVDEVRALLPSAILISPGRCCPAEAGISLELIRRFAGGIPILGVCLGHQAIGHAFGGSIRRAAASRHGKLSLVHHDGGGLFAGVVSPLEVVRHHSLVIDRATLPNCLEVTATSPDGEIMGVRHRWLPAVEGMQFRPESAFAREGMRMIENFLKLVESRGAPLCAA